MTAEQLRNSILQEAISGRLVPQDPNDEPAEIVSTVPEDEVPFEIPASWRWIRMKDCAAIIGGYAFPSASIKGEKGVRVIRISDICEKGFVNKSVVRYNGHENLNKFKIIPQDILIAMTGGTVGKSLFVQQMEEDMLLNQRVAIIRNNGQYAPYIDIVVKSPHIKSFINDKKNSTNDNISMGDINSFLVPLPPLAEQKRIVAKLEELLPIVEQYSKAQTELDELNAALPARLRQSILQEAISGRLVPQDPNDEPIAKILNTLGVKTIESEEDTPAGWSRIRMGEATEFINGLAFKPEEWKEAGLPIVRIQNLSNPLQPLHYTDKEIPEKFIIDDGQLLFSWSATLDAFIWNRGKACLNQHIFKLVPQPFIDKIYLYYLLKAIVEEYKKVTHGSTMKHITKGIFENYEILLPPLAEQKRIVAKIQELFEQIDKISK